MCLYQGSILVYLFFVKISELFFSVVGITDGRHRRTYLEALRNRLGVFGVHVCTIRPGFIDTEMTRGMDGLFWLISAEEAAASILKAARSKANVRYVPFRWALVGLVLRNIPSFVFRRLEL